MALKITSAAFSEGGRIPDVHTCIGADRSPPLAWSGAPPETASFVLVCEDPDAPRGTWHHWAVFDIPAETGDLAAGLAPDEHLGPLRQGINDFRRPGYGGPCPPAGHGTHHYHFRLLALSAARLDLGRRPSVPEVLAAARPHVLAEAETVGTFSR